MRYSGIIFLILAILIAGGATWVHNLWRTKQVFTEKLDTSKIDYYLSSFSLYATDSEGNNRFSVSGEHFVHQRATKKSEIYKPTIEVSHKGDTLTMVANKAEQDSAGNMQLNGMVTIQKPESETNAGFLLETSDLHFIPAENMVTTDSKVLLKTTDGSEITAIGMSEDLTTQTTRLKSNVHAEYTPATTE